LALNLHALAGAQSLAPATGLQVTVDTKPAKAAPAPAAHYNVPLPPITVSNQTLVRVGGQVIDLARRADLTPERGAVLAAELGVPQGVLTPLLQKAAKDTRPDGAQFAQDLRKATTNYAHWLNRYNNWKPADETLAKKKEEGLSALKAGDVDKAEAIYRTLPGRPNPPGNVRIAGP
jgi:hypothetical protein